MHSSWNLPSALIGLLDTPEIEDETDFQSMDHSETQRTVNRMSPPFFFLSGSVINHFVPFCLDLVDRLASSSQSIGEAEMFDKFQSLLKWVILHNTCEIAKETEIVRIIHDRLQTRVEHTTNSAPFNPGCIAVRFRGRSHLNAPRCQPK